MSVFDTSNQGENSEQKTDYVALLKEARGDNWEDPQVIAKGYLEAQKHIDEQKLKLEAATKNADQKNWAEEVISHLDKRTPTSRVDSQGDNAGTSDKGTPPRPSEDELKDLIRDTLTQQEKQRTAEQNIAKVDEGLRTLYGTEATEKLKDKAAEIGMSVDRLKSLAAESPTAFFQLIGEPEQKEKNSVPHNSVNTGSGFNQSGSKSWTYYQKMRRENPKLYRTVQVQNELVEERVKQGDKFYST